MSMLFDASALLNVVRERGGAAVDVLEGNYVITLTVYEIGNAIWKEAALQRRLSLDEALTLLGAIARICEKMRIVAPRNPATVLKIASILGITYYDAAYVVTAAENSLVLVTDDSELMRRLERGRELLTRELKAGLRVITSREVR
ncbi:MAG TPA: PIN domain-containing protein [Thermofilaceae archaeon]|nr:PIN domain-containing protein [Thermofilaceae archaeon]